MDQPRVIGAELLLPDTALPLIVATMQELFSWCQEHAIYEKENGLEFYSVEFKSAGGWTVPNVVCVSVVCLVRNSRGFKQRMILEALCSISRNKIGHMRFAFSPIFSDEVSS